ncbi:VTT domain-containing protein [Paeniglutamicibacter cryotolerans]|uniref:Membrane protein DedA with SNARE-associated domain/membrane-associated phospholipid phosphatase n=1 Tax=Paeniglutamicibacter cryotolerans TaxID=670079 RepID=A0A839QMD3_9MICC|nr:VTT domain-containing protein [Paeniglutamicibacter cryotolerans]MBB2997588.1 membrane protein DedA with SNARE-associated domain/membrane-associated phospholipid phosphatase [Paeniglutamicibacter cryotolerans]
MSAFLDSIISLPTPLVYVIVGALTFGEAAAFVGLVLPGETALFFGGVIASQGNVNLSIMLMIAIVAAIAGDSVGYEIGRRFGPRLKRSRAGRFVGAENWAKGEQFLAKRGGTAVLLGRWVGLLRALVPAIAGMSRMPYRTFLLYNSIGGTLWAVIVVLLGFFAGQSYKTVEKYLGKASLIFTLILTGALLIALVARFALRNPGRTKQWVDRIIDSRPLAALKTKAAASYPRAGSAARKSRWFPLVTAGGRVRGVLAVGIMALVGSYHWISNTAVTGKVLGNIDGTVEAWFLSHQDDEFTVLMQIINIAGHPVVVVSVLAGCVFLTRTGPVVQPWCFGVYLSGVLLMATATGIWVTHLAGQGTPTRGQALALDSAIGQPLISTALLTGAAWLLLRRYSAKWRRAVLTLTGLVAIAPLIALSHVYLGQQSPSDAVFGWLAGTLFAAAVSASWPTTKMATRSKPDCMVD